jgi:hypothetical protein
MNHIIGSPDDTEPQAAEQSYWRCGSASRRSSPSSTCRCPMAMPASSMAARRKRDLDARFRALHHEFRINSIAEEAEINPERDRIEGTLLDHLEKHAEPQTLAAAVVLLRHGFENGMQIDPDDGMVGNVLALIEREAGVRRSGAGDRRNDVDVAALSARGPSAEPLRPSRPLARDRHEGSRARRGR